jgi:hypothetical protein
MAREKDIQDALQELDKLPMVKVATKFIRILSANT